MIAGLAYLWLALLVCALIDALLARPGSLPEYMPGRLTPREFLLWYGAGVALEIFLLAWSDL